MEDITITTIDLLASEYGWSIEYIQTLDTNEIMELAKQIKSRKMEDLKMLSIVIAAGANGKTLDSLLKKANKQPKKAGNVKREEADMIKLFNLLGTPPQKLEEGLKKGRLQA